MGTRSIGKVVLYFDAGDEAVADLVENACARSLELIRSLWGLKAPDELRVYVMTSWRHFLFDSAPWLWRLYLRATMLLRRARFQKVWDMAGGWALRYGQRRVIGIKPPRLLEQVDADLRERVFVPRELDEAVQHNTCHELVHACSDALCLPTWLHEGLAMVTVDRYARRPTVNPETLDALRTGSRESKPRQGGYGQAGLDSLLYLAVRGYWITRYLAEAHPALLARQLARRQSHAELEDAVAAGLAMSREEFWHRIDGIVLSHFEKSAVRRGD
ncbi:MAG: hypothetical protein JXA93_02155 [Anaerolineae bacterium]|nr:hypothetical protein [Anaerolineae bacterium]